MNKGKNNRISEELLIRVYASTMKLSIIALFVMEALEFLLLLMTFVNPAYYGDYLTRYRICYVLALVAVTISIAMSLYIRKDMQNRYRILKVAYPVAALFFFIWIGFITYTDAVINGQVDPTAYMTFALSVPLCFYMQPPVFCAISVVGDLMLLHVTALQAGTATTLPNLIFFFSFQLIMGISVLRMKHNLTAQILETEGQRQEIEDLSKAQSSFFSNMSHEIRTPINTIIGFNEMILRENASEEINENAENIQSASRMLLHLINDILDMSKFESGQMQLTETAYHTGDMLSDIVGMLWIRASEKNLDFRVDISPDLPSELMGDEMRIKQILVNVLNNAIKYTREGSVRLSVQCERDGAGGVVVSYSVKDTGIGIRKESIPYLFTAFKRVDEDKNKYIEGTGLGLSIVKQFVDLMGGKITVNSVYTKGTTFVIEIPQRIVNNDTIGEMDMEKRRESKMSQPYMESFEAPQARVLVVDDTPANLLVVTKLLKDTKIQLTTAASGEEALRKTQFEPYHVILMDHKMPGMDGIECLHAIRSQAGGYCRESKIIALTANAGSDMEAMYEREGFDGYLIKPVTGEELEKELYRTLPRDLVTVTGSAKNLVEESTAWISTHKKKTAIRVTTESVADIPAELLKRYDINTIPHMVRTEFGLFKDGTEIDTRGLLALMQDPDAQIRTMSPNIEDHERFFSNQLDEANNIIHVSISDRVGESGCIAARKAADGFENVWVVNTGHLSSGQGLMAIEAARLAGEGLSPEAIVSKMEQMREHVHTSFIVDTLDFLARQKQVSQRIARIAGAFTVHPVLSLKKGRMVVTKLYLGSRERAWERYISSVFRVPGEIDRRMLFITYVGMTAGEIEKVRQMAESILHFDEVYCQKASPAVAVNCGPGTFGLLFFTKYDT